MKVSGFIGFALALLSAAAWAEPPEVIGRIQTMQGSVSIQRGPVTTPAAVGTEIRRGDVVRSGRPGAAGIVLTDDTSISLGSGSELSFSNYAFDPREGKFSLVVAMVKGTFAYLSGLIGKLAPNEVRLNLPDATIATRGSKVLIRIED